MSFYFSRDAIRLPLAIALALTTCASFAKDGSSDWIESVVVTGSRVVPETKGVAGSVTVIDRATIERRMDEDVLSLLRLVPGVHVAQAGGRSGFASIHMRGGNISGKKYT